MKLESKRIFISDLPETVLQKELEEKFTPFGNVTAVEIKERKDVGPKNTSHYFAFVNIDVDNHSLQQCFQELSNKKWKGQYVEIQLAKESFLDRLKKEREQAKSNGVTANEVESKESINDTPKPISNLKTNGNVNTIKKYESSSEDSSSSESENEDTTTKKKIFVNKIIKEPIEDVYADIVVKNNKNKKFDNKIESVGFEPIIKYEIGPKKPKSKDPARTKANEARLSSIQDMKKAYQQQKSAVQQALAKIDFQPKNKIIFDDNDSEVPLNKQAKHNHKESEKRKALFDEEDDEANDGNKFNFDVKKQFQGEKGQKLFELQSRYKNDDRFHMDSRFAENEELVENNADYDEEEMSQEEEKRKQYEILEQVLGKKITHKPNDDGDKRKGMLRFDPSQAEHSKYEIQNAPEKKKRKKHDIQDDKIDEVIPEVSKEKFYNVTDNLKEALQEKESFSLLSMFGTSTNEEKDDEEGQSTELVKKNKHSLEKDPNPFRYDSSSDEDDETEGKKVRTKKPADKLNAEESQKVTLGPSRLWTESFFFKADDFRFQEGVDFIRRLEIEDKSEFLKLRRNIKQIVRAKVRNNQRKNKPFKKKLGGSGRKKMIRVKKALKR